MNEILVDTSIWTDYFRGGSAADPLSDLIDSNRIATNDLILAELIPSIVQRKEHRLRDLLVSVRKIPLDIDWSRIIEMQIKNLKKGHNGIGIPDLVIAQNALDNGLVLFENDKHFLPINELFGLKLFRSKGDR